MITTLRSNDTLKTENGNNASFDLLERKNFTDTPSTTENGEDLQKARERMQRNLDKLLNYDRLADLTQPTVQEITVNEEENLSNEDIRPTSTTMQFGDDNVDGVFQDLNRAKEADAQATGGYKLNKKGKLIVFLYTLTVAVIFALIMLNTSVLANISNRITHADQVYSAKVAELNMLQAEAEIASSNETIIDAAEDLGMIIK